MSGIRSAIPESWSEKGTLQAGACLSCNRRMFGRSPSSHLAARWHTGRLSYNVSPAHGNAARETVSAAELDIIDAEMLSLAAADHERFDRDNVHDRVQAMLRPVALAVCPDTAFTRREPDADIATTWLYADMYLNWSDSFVRPEEDAIVFAIEQAWHRLCHQAPHSFGSTACAGTDSSKKAGSPGRSKCTRAFRCCHPE